MPNNEKTQNFDEFAETYDEGLENLLGVLGGGDSKKFAEYKIQLLKSILPCNIKSILDFGCGTGRSLAYFKKYYGEKISLYGCDVSEDSLKVANRVVPSAIIFNNSSVECFKQLNTKFDLVFLSCVLHHIEPKERNYWLKSIAENINDNGYLAVFEHNLINPCTKSIVRDPNNPVDIEEYMLTQSELENLLLSSDSKMKTYWKGYTLFSPIRFNKFITIGEKLLKWCPLGAQHCVVVRKAY